MRVPTLIVDDQADVRLLLRLLIDRANEGLVVVAEAASGPEALARVDESDPLVIILDEMMPDMNGLEAAAHIRARRPSQILILCSAYLDDDIIERARALGVAGCVSKQEFRELPDVIWRALGLTS